MKIQQKIVKKIHAQNTHAAASEYVKQYVQQTTIKGCGERMTRLKKKYLQFMLENTPKWYNKVYKTYKLKKIGKKIGLKLQF